MDICRDAPWHVRTGVGFLLEIYDNCIFCVGTMCTSSQYLMEYCDSGMGFCCNGILIIWIFVGTRHGTSVHPNGIISTL